MKLLQRSSILSLVVYLLAINNSAIAQTEESKSWQPSPELSRLEYFEGSWRCQLPAKPASPANLFIWTVTRDLNDFWYLGNAEEIPLSNESQTINSKGFLGYNASTQQLIHSVIADNGNYYNLTASDWQDRKLVWSGTVVEQGEAMPVRQEIIQASRDQFTATYFIPEDDGSWKAVADETCVRVSDTSGERIIEK